MPNIILYSEDQIDFEKLKSFRYEKFEPKLYGKLQNKFWVLYGEFKFNPINTSNTGYLESTAAWSYLANKVLTSSQLLDICNIFQDYVGVESDISVENVGKGTIISFIQTIETIINSEDKDYIWEPNHVCKIK